MNSDRRAATMVGVLFIVGTVAGVLSVVATQSLFGGPDYLDQISAHSNQLTLGALLILTMGVALAMIPAVIFPVLKRRDEVLAIGYVVFRGALETFTYLFIVIAWLSLIPLSQAFVSAGAGNGAYLLDLGDWVRSAADMSTNLTAIVFPLGAAMFYTALYRSKLIPSWLSVWGLIAVALHLVTAFLIIFGGPDAMSPINTAMNLPIFLQEMVMAVWLIVKGFNTTKKGVE